MVPQCPGVMSRPSALPRASGSAKATTPRTPSAARSWWHRAMNQLSWWSARIRSWRICLRGHCRPGGYGRHRIVGALSPPESGSSSQRSWAQPLGLRVIRTTPAWARLRSVLVEQLDAVMLRDLGQRGGRGCLICHGDSDVAEVVLGAAGGEQHQYASAVVTGPIPVSNA